MGGRAVSEHPLQQVVQQVIVPAYVWNDDKQRGAALTRIGGAMRMSAAQLRENVDVANARVQPIGMKAVVGHADVEGEDVSFVAYETCDLPHADLVMIVVDAKVIPS